MALIASNDSKFDPINDEVRKLELFEAQLCENSRRFEDMVEVMKRFTMTYMELTPDERNLLSCAYKNVLGSRRTSRRFLCEKLNREKSLQKENKCLEEKFTMNDCNYNNKNEKTTNDSIIRGKETENYVNGNSKNENNPDNEKDRIDSKIITNMLTKVEKELIDYCDEILTIIDRKLIPSATTSGEAIIFYYKMKGDYLRYLSEIYEGNERRSKSSESLEAYKIASNKAVIELPPTHPARLSLMLNFSVFYHEILDSPERSISLAKQAFDDAIAELDTLSEESYRDSTAIMQLLRDNLKMWEAERIS